MIVTHEREKLINAVIFFEEETNFLGKVKLFKLLYFLDFEHFKQAGRSVTGMDYYAWPKGPVPTSLNSEVDNPGLDMQEHVTLEKKVVGQGWKLLVKPRRRFDRTHFSKRELRMMRELAAEYRDTRADDMIEATHLENMPWHEVYEKEGRRQELIPYEYVLRKDEFEEMSRVITERNAVIDHFCK